MMIAPSALRRILLVLPMLVLAACNTVGEGSKIESLQIKDAVYGYDITPPLQTFRCLRYNLAAYGTFTDGSAAYYTDRATWSSSDPSVAEVSDGNIPLPSDATLFYSKGTVIPRYTGAATATATITADYVGVKTSILVSVSGTAPTITIVPSTTITPRPTAPTPPITIAPRTVQTYTALADLGGRMTDITNIGVWSVVIPSNATQADVDAIAMHASGGSFRGVAAGSVTVQADFDQMAGSCGTNPTTSLSVAKSLQSIAVSSQFGATPNPLVLNTTDRLKAIATLDLGGGTTTQDISELSITGDGTTSTAIFNLPTLTSSNGATDALTVFTYALNNFLEAIGTGTSADENSADVAASFAIAADTTCNSHSTADPKCVVSPLFSRSTQDGTLAAINICAVSATTPVNSCSNPGSTTIQVPSYLQYGEDGAKIQLRAIATFNLTGGGTVDQDITPIVTWTSSNSSIISIVGGGTSPYLAGVAGSIKAGTVTANASWSKDGVNTITSNTLTLVAQ